MVPTQPPKTSLPIRQRSHLCQLGHCHHTADRTMLTELSKSNNKLLKLLATKDTTISQLQKQLQQLSTNCRGRPGCGTQWHPFQATTSCNQNDNYCWTHGWDVALSHKSQTCSGPAPTPYTCRLHFNRLSVLLETGIPVVVQTASIGSALHQDIKLKPPAPTPWVVATATKPLSPDKQGQL
jgi:hypothetical protein